MHNYSEYCFYPHNIDAIQDFQEGWILGMAPVFLSQIFKSW